MALFKSRAAVTGAVPIAPQAGVVMHAAFTYVFTGAFTAASDVLELGILPANAKIIRMSVTGGALDGTCTADVGLMTGDVGADLNADGTARTSGTDFLNDAAIDGATVAVPAATLNALATSPKNRSIGVTLSADQTAGAAKTLRIDLEYVV